MRTIKVEQLDWSKLKPQTPDLNQGKKNYNLPFHKRGKPHKQKMVKPKDPHLFRESFEQRQHLRSIMKEES